MPCHLSAQRFSRVDLSLGSTISLTAIFQWIIFVAVVLLTVNASPTPELPSNNNDDAIVVDMNKRANYNEKLNWQSLQGAWGKRSSLDADLSAELNEADDDVYFAERRIPLMPIDQNERTSPILKYSLVYLKNAGGVLDHLANGDYEMQTEQRNYDTNNNNLLLPQFDAETENNLNALAAVSSSSSDGLMMENNVKRAWKSMNVGWGKRRNAPQWNKFKGAWGKREPGWNNLKGMWGKRSSKDWQKLHGSWGKRSMRQQQQRSTDTN